MGYDYVAILTDSLGTGGGGGGEDRCFVGTDTPTLALC